VTSVDLEHGNFVNSPCSHNFSLINLRYIGYAETENKFYTSLNIL
jgi:hypothetical protein